MAQQSIIAVFREASAAIHGKTRGIWTVFYVYDCL